MCAIRLVRLTFVALLLCAWGFIATTSGSVDSEVSFEDPVSTVKTVQENTMEQKITANLMVKDMEKTIAFYRDVLGFDVAMSQPENPPFAWVSMVRDGAGIMFATRESFEADPDLEMFKGMKIGGSLVMWIIVDDVKSIETAVQGKAEIVKRLTKQFYGMLELTIKDPNGYVLTFAQPVSE